MQLLQSEDFLDKSALVVSTPCDIRFDRFRHRQKMGALLQHMLSRFSPCFLVYFVVLCNICYGWEPFLQNSKLSKQYFTFNMQLKLIKSISSHRSFLNLREQTGNDIIIQFRVWKKNLRETCDKKYRVL